MDIYSLQSLLLFLLSILFFVFFYTQRSSNEANSKRIKAYPIVGCLPEFLKNRHRFLDWTTEVLAEKPTHTAEFLRPGRVHGIITANPKNVEYALKTHFDNFPKGDRFTGMLEDFLGRGIFNSDSELWKVW